MSPPFTSLPSSSSSSSPEWCPERQIYTNGRIPSTASVDTLLSTLTTTTTTNDESSSPNNNNNKSTSLLIFGYGSLCWHPGDSSSILSHPTVTSHRAQLVDRTWKRSWSQRSADHRGTTSFPGLVCTLLNEEERRMLGSSRRRRRDRLLRARQTTTDDVIRSSNVTKKEGSCRGVVYVIPPMMISRCLEELDLREQGGYSRDVVNVTWDDDNNNSSSNNDDEGVVEPRTTTTTTRYGKALLYRATASNPAFWKMAYKDWRFAAAVMSVAVGPSGPNDVYLCRLDEFLRGGDGAIVGDDDDDDTAILARECRRLTKECNSYWYLACGERKWGQLGNIGGDDHDGEEVDEMTEGVWLVRRAKGEGNGRSSSSVAGLFAGGGHSALLTDEGRLYLWGWNDYGQLGRTIDDDDDNNNTMVETDESNPTGYAPGKALPLSVSNASLGFSHSLVLEKTRQWVYAFGNNNRGQCTVVPGNDDDDAHSSSTIIASPQLLVKEPCIDISAGVFHSAVVTKNDGECLIFGCRKHAGFFGQTATTPTTIRWKPLDGATIKSVSCGRKHTVFLDSCGRLWTAGDNKYGQRGRSNIDDDHYSNPGLVEGFLGQSSSNSCRSHHHRVISISSGWSHSVALVKNEFNNMIELYGWGRNDKGQLGIITATTTTTPTTTTTTTISYVTTPTLLASGEEHSPDEITTVSCGSESTALTRRDGTVWSCGWNEHGNLGRGGKGEDGLTWGKETGARLIKAPGDDVQDGGDENEKLLLAVGGAHMLVMKV